MRRKVLKRLVATLLCGVMLAGDFLVSEPVYAVGIQEPQEVPGMPEEEVEAPEGNGDEVIPEEETETEETKKEETDDAESDNDSLEDTEPKDGEEIQDTTADPQGSLDTETVPKESDLGSQERNSPVWDGTVADGYAGGSGTESDPFQIATAEQLAFFAQDSRIFSSYYYQLVNDIYLNENLDGESLNRWNPVAKSNSESFGGNFNGNGHTIYNLYLLEDADSYRSANGIGLFNSSYGTIRNLTICNAKIQWDCAEEFPSLGTLVYDNYRNGSISECHVTGSVDIEILQAPNGVAGKMGGLIAESSGNIENCTMQAEICVTGKILSLGGIVGTNNETGRLVYCNNLGGIYITGQGRAGGIAYSSSGAIEDCKFGSSDMEYDAEGQASIVIQPEGSVSNESSRYSAAGIAYSVYGGGIIKGCFNYGSVTGYGNVAGIVSDCHSAAIENCENYGLLNGYYVSGIAADVEQGDNVTSLKNCANYADLTVSHRYGRAVGIANNITGLRSSAYQEIIIENCANKGTLKAENVCGIVMESEAVFDDKVKILKCTNEGALIGQYESEYGKNGNAYGIVGAVGSTDDYPGMILVKDCYNTGDITANGSAAGIAGDLYYGKIENCWNTGSVDGRYASGIVDDMGLFGTLEKTVVVRCYNEGELSGSEVGGILRDVSKGTVSSCYNIGNINRNEQYGDAENAGGILGNAQNFNGDILIENCFNCGNIIGIDNSDYQAGGIAGRLCQEGYSLSVRNCYNIGGMPDASKGGAAFASLSGRTLSVTGIYYLDNIAQTANWAESGVDTSGCHRSTDSQLKDASTYVDWDFDSVWSRGNRRYPYPLLQGVKRIDAGQWSSGEVFKGYVIAVEDVDFQKPIGNARIMIDDQCIYTDSDGTALYTGSEYEYKNVLVTGTGYENSLISSFKPDPTERNVISLVRKVELNVPVPQVSATVDVQSETKAEGKSIRWLDLSNFKIETAPKISNGDRATSLPLSVSREEEDVTYILADGTQQTRREATYKIVFGIKEKDEEGSVNKGTYDRMKNICQKAGKSKTAQKANELMESLGFKGSVGISISTKFVGYCKVKYNEAGKLELLEGGALIGMEGEGEMTYRPASAGGILYVKASLSLAGETALKLTFENEIMSAEAVINLEQALKIAGGLGNDDVHVELGAEGKLSESIDVPFKSLSNSLTIEVSATVYLEAKAFALKASAEKEILSAQVWPFPKKNAKIRGAAQEPVSVGEAFDLDDLEPVERDYLASAKTFRMTLGLDSENPYPYGTPQMARLSDGTVLAVWIDDLGEKSPANRTTLFYAVKTENGWEGPHAVCETPRGDFYPSLAVSGDTVHLVWTNIGMELDEDFTNDQVVENTDLYYSRFENGAFSEPVAVTEPGNKKLELEAKVASDGSHLSVIWLENSENDPFLTTGTNSICVREYTGGVWTDAQYLAEDLGAIYSLNSTYVDGELNVAYIMDVDKDPGTSDDAEVFLQKGGRTTRMTVDERADRYLEFSGSTLYWVSDGEIMRMENGQASTVRSTNITGVDDFQVLDQEGNNYILFLRAEGFSGELYQCQKLGETFSDPVPITDFGKCISDYAAVIEKDGNITAMLYEKEVLEGEAADAASTPYGSTARHLYDGLKASNLQLVSLYVDESELGPGVPIPVKLTLYNGGSQDLSKVKIHIDGQETIVDCDIKAGGNGSVSVSYSPGDDLSLRTLTVEVEPIGYEDSDPSDNRLTAEIGHGDLALEDTVIRMNADGSGVLEGKLSNKGYGPAESVSLKLWRAGDNMEADDLGKTPIKECLYGSLEAGGVETISIAIPQSYLDYADALDGKYFYLECESSSVEIRYDNNSKIVTVFPTAVTGITGLPETLEVSVGASTKLNVSVVPANALNQKIYYTTTDAAVAAVTEDGTVIGVEPGDAVITAITSDGGYTSSCSVTVKERAEQDPGAGYVLSDFMLSLEKGETGALSVKNAEGETVAEGVAWSSTNESVVEVDTEGNLTAKAKGTAYICASIQGSFDGVCLVTVLDSSLQAVVFEQSSLNMMEGESVTLTASCVPEKTAGSTVLVWTSDNEEIAVVSQDGTVSAKSGGQAVITAEAKDAPGIKAECRITVTAIPRYTITFDSDLGAAPVEVSGIKEGDSVSSQMPAEPEKLGYYFSGWFTEKNGGGEHFTEQTAVTGDLTVYAYWTLGHYYEGYVVEDIPDQVYTGSAIRPEPVVLDRNVLLVKGVDYTLTYQNNINQGTGKITIKGKGNYTKSMTVSFRIQKRDLSEEEISITVSDAKYTGKNLKPSVTVKHGKKTLKLNRDYTLEYSNNKDCAEKDSANPPTVKVIGKGNYEGEKTLQFRIYEKSVSSLIVDSVPKQAYTGAPVEPELTVRTSKKGEPLTEGYIVRYENNVKAGKNAKAVIEGTGVYGGTKTVKFQIGSKSIAAEDISINIISIPAAGSPADTTPSFTYVIGGVKPKVEVTDGGELLTEGVDYTLSYKNYTAAAAADSRNAPTVIVKGKGNYSGSVNRTFQIQPKALNADGITASVNEILFTGKERKPTVTVKDGNKSLKKGTHYTVDYENNMEVGEGIAHICGKGNYSGTIDLKFRIYEKAVSAFVADPIPAQTYQGVELEPPLENVRASKNGEALEKDVDYRVEYQNNYRAGKGKAVIIGIGKYGGTKTISFTIKQRSLTSAQIQLVQAEPFTYSGSAIKPEILVTDDVGNTLAAGTDYTVTYANNTNVPSASTKKLPTITVKGKGNYSGSKNCRFQIEALDLEQADGLNVTVTDVCYNKKKKQQIPSVTVKVGKKTLKKDRDYSLTYSNHEAVGELDGENPPTVTITGKGNYSNAINRQFRIYQTAISSAYAQGIEKQFYTGTTLEPPLVLKATKKSQDTLKEGVDYTICYENNVKVGTAKIVINGCGKYGGSRTVKFIILPKWLKWLP